MYEHMVIFKFNDELSQEQEQSYLNQLLAFKGKIPGIVELTAGVNVTDETDNHKGYSLGLRVTFKSKQDLEQYGPHPIHQEFVRSLSNNIEDVIVVDFPIN